MWHAGSWRKDSDRVVIFSSRRWQKSLPQFSRTLGKSRRSLIDLRTLTVQPQQQTRVEKENLLMIIFLFSQAIQRSSILPCSVFVFFNLCLIRRLRNKLNAFGDEEKDSLSLCIQVDSKDFNLFCFYFVILCFQSRFQCVSLCASGVCNPAHIPDFWPLRQARP